MPVTPMQELRRIAEAVGELRGRTVEDVQVRSDCRLLRITLDDGDILLVSGLVDEAGKPRLDVDLLRAPAEVIPGQLEVPFNVQQ